MATCPAGHESASTDFCDICGTRIDRPKVLDGRYTLGDVIGTGGMGQVFRAVTAEGRPAAVVFADGIGDATAALERIGVLARTAGEALGRLLRERRGEKSA